MACVSAAQTLLRQTAESLLQGANEDGCGVLGLAALIETRVRTILTTCARMPPGSSPVIQYETTLTNDTVGVTAFCVNGQANITRSPRVITVVMRTGGITARCLWHIAYTLHHELVCHAFQGALASRRVPNAHATCHWTEGWMDTVAFDLVSDWLADPTLPRAWLPLGGEDARGELW